MMTFASIFEFSRSWLGDVGAQAATQVSAQSGAEVPGAGTRLSVLAFELPKSITPEMAGLTVGITVGVLGIIAVLLFVGRGSRRPTRRAEHAIQAAPGMHAAPPMRADDIVFIPPYGTIPRDTPLPPQAFATPGRAYAAFPSATPAPVAGVHAVHGLAYGAPHRPHPQGAALPFVPSSQLSARVFAKMGYAVDVEDEHDAPNADPMLAIELDMLREEEIDPAEAALPPAIVLDTVVLDRSPLARPLAPLPASAPAPAPVPEVAPVSALRSSTPPSGAPHPLGIIRSSSSAMRAAPIADLAFDDNPTEIGETYFDEPPQPRRRTDPPKIRPIAPKGPRYPEALDRTPMLPAVTPPPMRAASRST